MRAVRPRKFSDPEVLNDMLSRYGAGETTKSLARAFCCDHTVIIFHAKKSGIYIPRIHRVHKIMTEPDISVSVPSPVRKPPHKYQHIIDEKVNSGKTYEEYRQADAKRQMMRYRCAQKAAPWGVPRAARISYPFKFRSTEEDQPARNTSGSTSIGWRSHRAIFLETTESQHQDPEPDLPLLEDSDPD